MKLSDFQREFECVVKNPEKAKQLREIALRYHRKTEAFDQAHCSSFSRTGFSIPATGVEMFLCNKNALYERKRAILAGERLGFDKQEVEAEIRSVSREFDKIGKIP